MVRQINAEAAHFPQAALDAWQDRTAPSAIVTDGVAAFLDGYRPRGK